MNLGELLIDESIDQVFALNTTFEVIVWNKACEIATGIEKNEIIGKNVYDRLPGMKENDTIRQALDAALRGNRSFVPHNKASHDKYYAERHFLPLRDDDRNIIGILVVTRDVAHRVKAEQELRALNLSLVNFKRIIDSAHDIILTFDVNGQITYWNAAAERTFGYSAEEILGMPVARLLPDEKRDLIPDIMDELRADKAIDIVTSQRTKEGNEIEVAANIFAMADENNVFVGGCKIARDITDILKYQKSIEILNDELTTRNRQLASVNSELKTFTSVAVNNYQETLRQLYLHFEYIMTNDAGKLSDPGKANIRKAQAAIQKMKLLTNDIIAFTRLNEFDTKIRTIDLDTALGIVVDDLRDTIEAANAKVDIGELPEIHGYPFLVSLVFHHLLQNAIKFRKDKVTPIVEVFSEGPVRGSEVANGSVRPHITYHVIVVKDNGIGFDNTEAENIFQIFTRLQASRYKGSGIGLAICKKAMELHGGTITTESQPGEGSSFRCFFPTANMVPPFPIS